MLLDTNQLLSIAFTIISNFTNVVRIAPDHVPQDVNDLGRIVVGSPRSPCDLYLIHKKGDMYWLHDGVVEQYESPDSYFNLQSLAGRARLVGEATIKSNQAVEAAGRIMKSLVKRGNPLETIKPRTRASAGDVHFFYVSWPATNMPYRNGLGAVEIDARSGRVAFVQLRAAEFFDLEFAAELTSRVCRGAPLVVKQSTPNPAAAMPKPTRQEIDALIPKWLLFCKRLKLDPGSQTTVEQINWTETFVSTKANLLEPGDLCKIQFKDGAVFESVNGKIFLHSCGDAAFVGSWAETSPEHWARFGGEGSKDWHGLATELNKVLVSQLGVSPVLLGKYEPTLYARGTGGMARCLVRWCEAVNVGKLSPEQIKTAILAEFDLSSGRIKSLRIDDAEILNQVSSTER